ncbi:MAG: response regulator [Treponema sp.]|jgi:signal transduction histidine kinase/ActR/RegA family two-component response regulator|nr:response regulator [Treponema sp.]
MSDTKNNSYLLNKIVFFNITIAFLAGYAVLTLIYCFLFLPFGSERLYRLFITAWIFVLVLYLNLCAKIPLVVKSWLVPFTAIIGELIIALLIRGDRLYMIFIIAWEIISFTYLTPSGLLLYLLASNAVLIPTLFFFRFNILGVGYLLSDEAFGILTYELIGIILLLLSVLIHRRFYFTDKTSRTFETIMETIPNYMVIINETAEVEYISASLAATIGMAQRQYVERRPLLDLFSSGDMKMKFHEFMERGGFIEENFEATVHGKKMWFMMRSSPLEEGKRSRLFEWTDITPIMEAKNEAESAARAKNDFLTNMSHEIRTPMNAIIGMTDLMLTNPLEPEQMTRADTIKGAAFSLLNIINDILDFSKIDARKMEIIVKPFDIAALIADTVNLIAVKANAAKLSLTTAISKDIPPIIKGDEIRLKQCLINILNNAVKFTNKGYIQLRAWAEPLPTGSVRLHFSVQDTGIGIRKEDMGKLFGEFQQLDTRKNRNIEGTGLGLAITRRLVELMGGTVRVESIYGTGTLFSFYVVSEGPHAGKLIEIAKPKKLRVLCYELHPFNARAFRDMLRDISVPGDVCIDTGRFQKLLSAGKYTHVFFDRTGKTVVREFLGRQGTVFVLLKEIADKYDRDIPNVINRPLLFAALADVLNGRSHYERRPRREDGSVTGSLLLKDCRVLVVDDNAVNLTVAAGLLRRYGIMVDTAADGEEALANARKQDYDIIFMDHLMPGMDGLDATKAIRALDGPRSQVVIIALTANAVVGFQEQFLEAGMNGFLPKPIILKRLREILLTYLPREKIVSS